MLPLDDSVKQHQVRLSYTLTVLTQRARLTVDYLGLFCKAVFFINHRENYFVYNRFGNDQQRKSHLYDFWVSFFFFFESHSPRRV